jgi:two-component system cell cycle response regulator DivK
MILKDKNVYIVEDNPDNVFILMLILRKHGARVQVDWWARGEVNRLLKALPLDLIILDLMLPGGRTGFDILGEIRSLPALNHIPVIAVSAADPSISIPKAIEKGFAGFIAKPVDDELFPVQIAKVINNEQVWYAGLGSMDV